MALNSLFNRTVKTNIIIYPTDGCGRDGYITYNNAGFWKQNIKQIVPKELCMISLQNTSYIFNLTSAI